MTDAEIDCLERQANDSCECDSGPVLDLIDEVRRLRGRLVAVEKAIRDYHFALDEQSHGGATQYAARTDVERAMGMQWVQGAEAERRKGSGR